MLNHRLNPVTAQVSGGILTLEAFPRKKGYELVGVLQKPGREPVFASHGVYPNKPAAVQGMREILESFKKNPRKNSLFPFMVALPFVPPNPRIGSGIFHFSNKDKIGEAILRYLKGDAKALDRMPSIKTLIDKKIGQSRGATGNPSLYKSFHGNLPKVVKVQYTPPKAGEKLTSIGKIEEIVYKPYGSSKRKNISYSHKSGDTGSNVLPGKMILAVSQDGKRFYLLRGNSKAKMTERGIVG